MTHSHAKALLYTDVGVSIKPHRPHSRKGWDILVMLAFIIIIIIIFAMMFGGSNVAFTKVALAQI